MELLRSAQAYGLGFLRRKPTLSAFRGRELEKLSYFRKSVQASKTVRSTLANVMST